MVRTGRLHLKCPPMMRCVDWMGTNGSLKAFHRASITSSNVGALQTKSPKKRGLANFNVFCKFLVDKSKLSVRPTNKGHKLI